MSKKFCISVHWHHAEFHGRSDGGEPEWPPSPLRLFQAILAAAAVRWRETSFRDHAQPALRWLECRVMPTIVAVSANVGRTHRLYVPDNVADKVASSWTRSGDASIADYRTEKDVRPLYLGEDASVHYLWPISEGDAEFAKHRETLAVAARSMTHLGWGIDMVAGNASVITEDEAAKLSGEVWRPSVQSGGQGLRVPIDGTLDALVAKHEAFLGRLTQGFNPVPPLTAFRVVSYRRDDDPGVRPYAAFKLMRADADGMAHFAANRAVTVAGMVRHAVAIAAEAKGDPAWVAQFVLGHRENPADTLPRFAYLPLPTLEPPPRNVAGAIRRVLFAEPIDAKGTNVDWARRIVSGQVATNDAKEPVFYFEAIAQDGVVSRYVQPARTWTTVTPVVLPGCDGGSSRKTDKLLKKMFRQAGYSLDMLEDYPEFQREPYVRGAEDALRYRPNRPHYLAECSIYHMRIRWKHTMRGPIALGSGRFCGLGLFFAESGRQ